jgi:hypothetical protein
MSLNLSILYRGPLASCNYDCDYCPFAKHRESWAELARDRDALERFVTWATSQVDLSLGVLFTPWGEALVRHWYQAAIVRLSHLPHVRRVAIQTNLSCRLDWLDRCDPARVGLWCTYHPTQVAREAFVARCADLDRRQVRYSVGVVGTHDGRLEAEALRRELPEHVYLWVNAYKRQPEYYSPDDLAFWESIDPMFRLNLLDHPSLGRTCRCGTSVISVDGDGTIRRCHFIKQPIGNIYDLDFRRSLFDRPCPNRVCGCHIGYVHMDALQLGAVYGDGVLERVPRQALPNQDSLVALAASGTNHAIG